MQSPSDVQSEGGATANKRGIGAVVDAVPTVETGASETLLLDEEYRGVGLDAEEIRNLRAFDGGRIGIHHFIYRVP